MARLNVHPGIHHDASVMATHVGMAHFAGTGPAGTSCTTCEYRVKGGCSKFVEMTKGTVRTYPKDTPSCKYYAAKKTGEQHV